VAIQARLALSGAAERAATLGAHEQAVSYLRQAIEITTDPKERADLNFRAARSANAAAEYADAQALVRAGIDVARAAGDVLAAGAGEALLGEILIDNGQPPEAVAVLEAALAAFPASGEDEVWAAILANLSRALMRSDHQVRAVEAADQALDIAERLGLERLALLGAAVELARAGGFVAAELRALNNFANGLDDFHEGRAAYAAAEELATRVGNRSMASWARETGHVYDYFLARDWDGVLAGTGETAQTESALDEVRRHFCAGIILLGRGQSADAAMARIEALSGQVSDPFYEIALHTLRGERAMLAGDFATATDEGFLSAAALSWSAVFLPFAARAALWAGDVARARQAQDRLDEDLTTGSAIFGDRLAARAGVAALEGRVDDAVTGYREAMARHASVGTDLARARAGLDLVRLVGGSHPAGREAASEARAIFERVKAQPYLDLLDAAEAGKGIETQPAAIRDVAAPQRTRG